MSKARRAPPASSTVLPDQQTDQETLLALKDRALTASSEGITIADARLPDEPLIYVNEGFERLTGYAADEILGQNCRILQGPDPDQDTVAVLRGAIKNREPCTIEIKNFRKDGTPFWNRLSINPVRDTTGTVTHFIGIQSDITARKEAEEALRKAKGELEATNRRMRRDLEAAARIQQALLPARMPEIGGVHFAWQFLPSQELAGDTLNIIPLDDDHVGIYVLDVSGHGVQAALLSVTLHHWLSPIPEQSDLYFRGLDGYVIASPSEVAERLNRRFPMDRETHQYFTILYGILDTGTRHFRYVTAGHPAPMYLPRGGPARDLQAVGFPVGFVEKPDYQEHILALEPGDRLLLYTDGATEARNGREQPFGEEQFRAALEDSRDMNLEESLREAVERITRWQKGVSQADDISMLAFEIGRPTE